MDFVHSDYSNCGIRQRNTNQNSKLTIDKYGDLKSSNTNFNSDVTCITKSKNNNSNSFALPKAQNSSNCEIRPEDHVDKSLFRFYPNCDLTLSEIIYILSVEQSIKLKYISSNGIELVLKGCLLIELAFNDRIELDKNCLKKVALEDRKVVIKNREKTGNHLLDRLLKILIDGGSSNDGTSNTNYGYVDESVINWISLLNGDTWNPFKIKYKFSKCKETIAKNLVEKGVAQYNSNSSNLSNRIRYLLFESISSKFVTFPVQATTDLYRFIINVYTRDYSNQLYTTDLNKFTLALVINIANLIQTTLTLMSESQFNKYANVYKDLISIDFAKMQFDCYHNQSTQDSSNYKKLEFVLSVLQSLQILL